MKAPLSHSTNPKNTGWKKTIARSAEVIAFIGAALFLFIALKGDHPVSSVIREYLVERGVHETGALNLVTSIYLGFRAYDTLGETIVLLLAVSGALLFLEKDR